MKKSFLVEASLVSIALVLIAVFVLINAVNKNSLKPLIVSANNEKISSTTSNNSIVETSASVYSSNNQVNTETSKTTKLEIKTTKVRESKLKVQFPISINNSAAKELEGLTGIGEVIAQRVVDYRNQNGKFTSLDQLLDVKGIGPAKLADIKKEAVLN